jgi:hypothetical protein
MDKEPLFRKIMWLSAPLIVIPLTGEVTLRVIAWVRKVVELVNKLSTGRCEAKVIVIPASPPSKTMS